LSPLCPLLHTAPQRYAPLPFTTLFRSNAAGPTPLSGSTPVVSGASWAAGTDAVSESGPSGYTASAWSCSGGTQNGANITVGLGETATCTINNNDNPPALHLRKTVTNDNGGTAVETAWTLNAPSTPAALHAPPTHG